MLKSISTGSVLIALSLGAFGQTQTSSPSDLGIAKITSTKPIPIADTSNAKPINKKAVHKKKNTGKQQPASEAKKPAG